MISHLTKRNYPYYILLPGLLVFLIFFVYPSLSSFYYAFTNWDGLEVRGFVGFDNFRNLMDQDSFGLALRNTFLFTFITTFFKLFLGLLLAILANMALRSAPFLRSILFLPVVLSSVAVGLAFSAMYEPDHGLINQFLHLLHLDAWTQSWLTNINLVVYSISVVEIWKSTGFCMMLFLAGLQTIPKELYESAKIDGANSFNQFRFITVPFLRPVININFILTLISGLKVFDIVYTMTGGGPAGASQVISTVIYKAFSSGYYGEATAANILLFLFILVIVVVLNKQISNKETGV
jgi:raffinose/stachyose/melibiose transport system permease protein